MGILGRINDRINEYREDLKNRREARNRAEIEKIRRKIDNILNTSFSAESYDFSARERQEEIRPKETAEKLETFETELAKCLTKETFDSPIKGYMSSMLSSIKSMLNKKELSEFIERVKVNKDITEALTDRANKQLSENCIGSVRTELELYKEHGFAELAKIPLRDSGVQNELKRLFRVSLKNRDVYLVSDFLTMMKNLGATDEIKKVSLDKKTMMEYHKQYKENVAKNIHGAKENLSSLEKIIEIMESDKE